MIRSGDILDNKYRVINEIGEGGAGVVYLAYHLSLEKYVVLKKMKYKSVRISDARTEVDILKKLRHECLPTVYDFFQYGDDVYTVIDYIQGNDLSWYEKNGVGITEEQAIKWLKQLCGVLVYLHGNNPPIIHSDIKPSNIMIDPKGNLCLIDFNISLDMSDTRMRGATLDYASPEQLAVFNNQASAEIIDPRSDIYSLGATFFRLITGIRPYIGINYEMSVYELAPQYRRTILNVIKKAMEPDPNNRFSSALEMQKAVQRSSIEYRMRLAMLAAVAGFVLFLGVIISTVYVSGKKKTNERNAANYAMDYNDAIVSFNSGKYNPSDLRKELLDEFLNNPKYTKLIDNSSKSELKYMIGYTCFQENDYDQAIDYYEEAVEDDSENNEALRELAICYARIGNTKKAEQYLERAEEAGVNKNDIMMVEAEIAFESGDYSESIDKIKEISGLKSNEQLYERSALLCNMICKEYGDYSLLIELYGDTELIDVQRMLMNACNSQSTIASDENEKVIILEKALFYADKISKSSYYSSADRMTAANIYFGLGRINEAIAELEGASDSDSNYMILGWRAYYAWYQAGNTSEGKALELLNLAYETESYKNAYTSDSISDDFKAIETMIKG